MSALPYIRLYIPDYLSSTAHLNPTEHGVYLLLIMNYWQRGGPLPADKASLSQTCGMSRSQFNGVFEKIVKFFCEIDGLLYHSRIEHELLKVSVKSQKNSNSGKLSAAKRANERSTNVDRTFNHTDTDTDTDKEKTIARKPRESVLENIEGFEFFWTDYPRKIGKGAAKKAWKSAILKTSPATIAAATRIFASKQAGTDEKFIPHPATWLNAERWQDADLQPKASLPYPQTSSVYVMSGTDQWDVWQDYTFKTKGKTTPRDSKGGWWFPSEYPPQQSEAA